MMYICMFLCDEYLKVSGVLWNNGIGMMIFRVVMMSGGVIRVIYGII